MHIFSLSENNISSIANQTAIFLKNGAIGIYPTETLYGIGTSIANHENIIKCNQIKNRPDNTPQILLIRYEWISRYIVNYERFLPLLDILWAGKFTVILESYLNLPFSSGNKIAFRVSPHPFIESMLTILDEPITSSSANRNQIEPKIRFVELVEEFRNDVDFLVYDKNDDPQWRKPVIPESSTMLDATEFPSKIKIIRGDKNSLSKITRIFPSLEVSR